MTALSVPHVTTNDTLAADLRASLRAMRLEKLAELLTDAAANDPARALLAAKIALNALDPDAYDAAVVKAAEQLHAELGGTVPWRDVTLYERAFSLSLAAKAVDTAFRVLRETMPIEKVTQAIADLSAHKSNLIALGQRNILFPKADQR